MNSPTHLTSRAPTSHLSARLAASGGRALTIATPFGPYEPPLLRVNSLSAIKSDRTSAAAGPKRQILIVDEDPISCARLATLLRECGHQVLAADSPTAADRLRTTEACDLLVANLRGHPTELLAWLTRVARDEAPPILTIGSPSADEPSSPIPGAAGHLSAPVQRRALSTLVGQLLRR